jgi:hypothetical protein
VNQRAPSQPRETVGYSIRLQCPSPHKAATKHQAIANAIAFVPFGAFSAIAMMKSRIERFIKRTAYR